MLRFAFLQIWIFVSVLTVVADVLKEYEGNLNASEATLTGGVVRRSTQVRDCNSVPVEPCARKGNRDIVFLVDASESLDAMRFYSQFLDFVQTSWCGFDSTDENRGAMITFGHDVVTRIPFARYSAAEWFEQVEEVRANPAICCSCCTPTAEAFRAARMLLTANPPPTEDTTRLVMLISDGDPWQNKVQTPFPFPKILPATYTFEIVPQQAYLLKNLNNQKDSVRLLFLGVPNKHGKPPSIEYFIGNGVLGKSRCIKRARRRECVKIPANSPYFPISSTPVDKYISVSNLFDVGDLISIVGDDLCRPITASPAQPTTNPPGNSPTTKSPTAKPSTSNPNSKSPTAKPSTNHPTSKSPTARPSTSHPTSKAPTTRPTTNNPTSKGQTAAPITNHPTSKTPTSTPTAPSTNKPTTKGATQVPTISAAEDPSVTPTRMPTFAPANKPQSRTPTQSPTGTKPEFNHLDLYLLLDRSKSMRWRAPSCRAAPGSNQTASDDIVCWQLFLGFARDLANKTSHLIPPSSTTKQKIGWQADFPDSRMGLRVWLYGFACTNHQTTPVVQIIGERINSLSAFQSAITAAYSIVPTGGTCPGASFERALGMVLANDLFTRPYKAALLFTDGVFYDQPRPATAAKGFAKLGVMTYSLGISIPNDGNNQGLTPKEVKDQKTQLLAFANGVKPHYLNFGAEGYSLLNNIATSFVTQLPADVDAHIPQVIDRPWWCGWSSSERCLNVNPVTFESAKYCKWIPDNPDNFHGRGRCLDKDWCSWATKAKCNSDSWCKWSGGGACKFKGWGF